jgi:hypothetical protein
MWQFEKNTSPQQAKKKWLKLALETCEFALQDPDTHVIFHPWIQKRLLRLERTAGIPKAEQHTFAHVALRPPVVREFTGVRLDDRDTGKKSVWRSTRDSMKEISVEELCLEQYEDLGWKGFHSENGVVTTIVTLFVFISHSSLRCYTGTFYSFLCEGYSKLPFRRHRWILPPTPFSRHEGPKLIDGWLRLRMDVVRGSSKRLMSGRRLERRGVWD